MGELCYKDNLIKATYSIFGGQILYITPPEEGTSWDFSNDDEVLTFEIMNPSNIDQGLFVRMETANSIGRNGRMFRVNIPADGTYTVYVLASNQAVQLGMHTYPELEPGKLLAFRAWDNDETKMDVGNINLIKFTNMSERAYCEFEINNIRMEKNPITNPSVQFKNIVDKYGQYSKKEWENKVKTDDDIIRHEVEEQGLLDCWIAQQEAEYPRSKYGGFLNEILRQSATGRFYVKKLGRQWVYIDPLGYPFFSTGLDVVKTENMRTRITGREYMFEYIPPKDSRYTKHYSECVTPTDNRLVFNGMEAYNFYTTNLQIKYGENWKEQWFKNTQKRFKAWGINTVGCWTDEDLVYGQGEKHKMVYTANVRTSEGKHTYIFSSIPDVYAPEYKEAVEKAIESLKEMGVNEDVYCIGVFVDNEIQWGRQKESESEHYKGVESAMALDAQGCYTKCVLVEYLQKKYMVIEALNNAFGTSFIDFQELLKPYTGNIPEEDKSMMLYMIAEKYYALVNSIMKEKLPDVLYLGSRLADWGTSEQIVDACSKHVDVISFNCYKETINQSFMDFDRYDKPMILGEFHMCSTDRGSYAPGLVPAGTSERRAEMYKTFVESALHNGRFVGVHWFKYCDQPSTGVVGNVSGAENCNVGFVDITDYPYYDLLQKAREVHKKMYETKLAVLLKK